MLKSKLAVAASVAALCVVAPASAYAWNIVCGVSILAFRAESMNTKWEADSAAIKGMSEFYAAIADLQSINVEILQQTIDDRARQSEIAKTKSAVSHFKASQNQLTMAQAKAKSLTSATNTLDSMGTASISLWSQLSNLDKEFISNLEGGSLPELNKLHDAIGVTQEMGNVGIRASLLHLAQHKMTHTAGGSDVKFQK